MIWPRLLTVWDHLQCRAGGGAAWQSPQVLAGEPLIEGRRIRQPKSRRSLHRLQWRSAATLGIYSREGDSVSPPPNETAAKSPHKKNPAREGYSTAGRKCDAVPHSPVRRRSGQDHVTLASACASR
jgi:hypothetical protein